MLRSSNCLSPTPSLTETNLMSTANNLQSLQSIHASELGGYSTSPNVMGNSVVVKKSGSSSNSNRSKFIPGYGFIEVKGQGDRFECKFLDGESFIYFGQESKRMHTNVEGISTNYSIAGYLPDQVKEKMKKFREMVK